MPVTQLLCREFKSIYVCNDLIMCVKFDRVFIGSIVNIRNERPFFCGCGE